MATILAVAAMATFQAPTTLPGPLAPTLPVRRNVVTCAGDPEGGECAAAWDEVEELSAAASHARDRKKDSDPLEEYCKDNPETDECRTYED
uniref:CP12 domain-containing protein n=1 Tax=Oryza barthii TaxID=65489 RepID=A0A0D3FHK2_9ORYZ